MIAAALAAALVSTPVGVAEREFRISLYRPVVPPGEVRFNVTNFGEDTHDLAVVTRRGLRTSEEIRSGRRGQLVVTLRRPGRYPLLCTLADHADRGMRATLTVRRPRKR